VVGELQRGPTASIKATHSDEDFALLPQRDATRGLTLASTALAPLLGMESISAFDTQEHPLADAHWTGSSYHDTTRSQFLSRHRRTSHGRPVPDCLACGPPKALACLVYVDGPHVLAYGSRRQCTRAKIPMAWPHHGGSQAVIRHRGGSGGCSG